MKKKRIEITPVLTEKAQEILEKLANSRTVSASLSKRAYIILESASGKQDIEIAKEIRLHYNHVGKWRNRYLEKQDVLKDLETSDSKILEAAIETVLSDLARSGKPPVFTADQVMKIIALACTHPKDHGYEQSQWSLNLLVEEIVKSGIAESISAKSVSRFLKYGGFTAT